MTWRRIFGAILAAWLPILSCFAQTPDQNLLRMNSGIACPAQAQAFFVRLSAPLTAAQRAPYCRLFSSLIASGVWEQLDDLLVLGAPTQSTALVNLVSSSYTASAVNSPTFTANQGFAANGTSSYINTEFLPSGGVHFKQNSGHIAIWDRTSRGSVADVEVGSFGTNNSTLIDADNGGAINGRVNSTTSATGTVSSSQGFSLASRTTSLVITIYWNGQSVGSGSLSSASPIGNAVFIGGLNFNGTLSNGSTDQIAMFSIGGSLNSAQALSFYAAIYAFLHSVGAA